MADRFVVTLFAGIWAATPQTGVFRRVCACVLERARACLSVIVGGCVYMCARAGVCVWRERETDRQGSGRGGGGGCIMIVCIYSSTSVP